MTVSHPNLSLMTGGLVLLDRFYYFLRKGTGPGGYPAQTVSYIGLIVQP